MGKCKSKLVSRRLKKRIISLVLIVIMMITVVPIGSITALADDKEQCGMCGSYVTNEEICNECGNCALCHVNETFDEGAWCEICHQCFYSTGGFCEEYWVCYDCIEEYGTHCPECDDCYCDSDEGEQCPECGLCKKCGNSCLICNRCENDWEHCEICDACYEETDPCASGGEHCSECCENNGWLCPQCGECIEANDTELCDICGLCLECCEDESCSECGMCAEDTDFDVHFCEECGDCLEVKDICDDCGLCRECCLEFVESIGCTCEDYCWTDPALEEHICEDCGTCFGKVDACESCYNAGEIRCVNCCEEYSRYRGCDCDDFVCPNSKDWEQHMEELHTIPTGEHKATPQQSWSFDSTGHWHDCKWCDEKSHESAKFNHTLDSKERCVVCGYSESESIIILSQPKDATSVVSDRYEGIYNTVKFKVNAWSKDGADNLHYRWYSYNGDESKPDDSLEYFCTDDASSAELIMNVFTDACYWEYEDDFIVICKITDDYGNEVWSRPARLIARHKYKIFGTEIDKNDVTAEYHTLRCVGDGCIYDDDMIRRQAHTFSDWVYEATEDGKGKKYKECTGCGYRKEAKYHDVHHSKFEGLWNPYSVITVDPEDNDGKYEGYYVDSYGKTVEFGGDTYWHWETCAEDGCTVKVRSKHNYGAFQAIDKMPTTSSSETHGYRECSECAYQDSVLHKYIDEAGNEHDRVWKYGTHPIEFTVGAGTSNPYLAYGGEKIKIYPTQNGLNKIDKIKVSILYKTSATAPLAIVNDISNKLVEIIPGKEYELVVPKTSSRNGYYYNAYPIEVEVYYSDELCKHDGSTVVENAVEPTCVNEGYSGDTICNDCGAIVKAGVTIPAKGHGEEVKVTESVRMQTWTKQENGKYGYVDKKDSLGRYVYAVQAETTVKCSDPDSKYERGSYTGDYVCADCGVITTKGKYVSKEHRYEKVSIARDYSGTINGYSSWRRYLWDNNAKDFVKATMTTEGYSGDRVCYYCGHIARGRVTDPIKVKYIENISIKGLVAPIPGMTEEEFNEKYPISFTKPANGLYEYHVSWEEKNGKSLRPWDEFEEGKEYIPYIVVSTDFGDDNNDGIYENTYLFLGFSYDVDSKGIDVFTGNYEGTVTGIDCVSIEKAQIIGCEIIIEAAPMMADYLVVDNSDIIIGNIKPIVGKTPAECAPSIIMSDQIESSLIWYKNIYDKDGVEIENSIQVTKTDVFEAGEEYFVEIELLPKPEYKFDVTQIDRWNYQYNGNITFQDVGDIPDIGEKYLIILSKGIKAVVNEGWQKIDGSWYYFVDGEKQTNWQDIDGEWYYLDETGVMLKGWQEIGGKWYYFGTDGVMTTGWQNIGTKRYYFSKGGVMLTSWQKIDGKWYYFNANGAMQLGWKKPNNKWYYFDETGAMLTSWQKIDGKWYYFNASGAMQTGWQKLNNKWYFFNNSGVMLTDWQEIGGKWYFFNTKGAMQLGWQKLGTKWYYFNASGVMLTDWQEIDGEWYYFNAKGAMATGWQKLGTKWYYFDASGVMLTDWQEIGGKWYYFNAKGAMATGWQKLGTKWFYFNASGVMQTNWQKIDGKWYYFNAKGAMQTGWVNIGGKYYYFYEDGSMATDTYIGKYYVDANGVWVK